MKKLGLALTSVGSLFLLGIILVGINYISWKYHKSWDFSGEDRVALSDKTKSILRNLKQDVEIYVCFSPRLITYNWIKALLQKYQNYTKHLKVTFVDVERDIDQLKALASKYNIVPQNVVIFVSGPRHKIVYERDLIEMDYTPVMHGEPPRPGGFNGEAMFTSAIMEVCSKIKPVVYVLTGHGERRMDDIEPGRGIKEAVELLRREGYDVEKVILVDWQPKSKSLLIVCRPKTGFLSQEIEKLDRFLKEGGRMLLLLDPGADNSLRKWLEENYGVLVGDNVVVDPALNVLTPINLFVNYYGLHPITKPLIGTALLLTQVCSVQWKAKQVEQKEKRNGKEKEKGEGQNSEGDGGQFNFSELLFSSPKSWAEADWHTTKYKYDEGRDVKGPVCLAVAGKNSQTGARLVVVGDSDFVTNVAIDNLSNRDFFLDTVNWLMEFKERLSIGPKPIKTIKLNLPYTRWRAIFWLSVVILPLGMIGLGIMVVMFGRK